MSSRVHHFAAAAALSALTATQALAATFGTPDLKITTITPKINLCFTRVFFTPTNSQLLTRQCAPGEPAGSVKVSYVG